VEAFRSYETYSFQTFTSNKGHVSTIDNSQPINYRKHQTITL